MKYIEKDYPAFTPPDNPFDGAMGKMPYFLLKKMLDKNLPKLRQGMGGKSADITRRPITQKDVTIRGYQEDILLRVYTPADESAAQRPLMLFMHGGGWIGGSIGAVEEYCKAVSDRADCIVVSVDYHLAPEYPYPCGVQDSYKALEWAWNHADELGANRKAFCVSGDSAGGNYAAVLTLLAKEQGKIALRSQILLYPCVRMGGSDLFSGKGGAFGRAILDWYLAGKTPWDNPHVSPFFAKEHADLPRAMIVVCEYDPLQAEGRAYAEKLEQAGVDTTLIYFKNTAHAFMDNTGTLQQAEDLVEEVVAFLKA